MDGIVRGEIAKKADVNPETLPYYERKELIPVPPRSGGGYRLCDEHDVDRLRFIQRTPDLGFTRLEIKGLLEFRVDEEVTCRNLEARAQTKLSSVEEKIRDHHRIPDALSRVAETCAGGENPTGECPILDAMEKAGPGTEPPPGG